MPGRKHGFQIGNYYHIYNKTIDGKRVFESATKANVFLHMLWYYRPSKVQIKHSRFLEFTPERQIEEIPTINNRGDHQINILAYCIMPTHYHILAKETVTGGISSYMSKLQNSFTRYYNTMLERKGQLFVGSFRSKLITSEEVLKHVARYIHLNPFSSGQVTSFSDLPRYPWSSQRELCVDKKLYNSQISNPDLLLGLFDNDVSRYERFLENNAEYQKSLEYSKHSEKFLQ